MGYFEYFDIKHSDTRYKHLGEFIEEFDKNILNFSDLMTKVTHGNKCRRLVGGILYDIYDDYPNQ